MLNPKNIFTALLLCLGATLDCAGQPPPRPAALALGMTESTFNTPQGDWVKAIYQEVFDGMGIELKIIPLPTNRASAYLKSGEIDGDVHRSLAFASLHPDLVRVQQSHFSVRFAAYGKRRQATIQSWDSFDGCPARIDYILGSITPGLELAKHIPPEHLSTVKSVEQGLRKLDASHSDILVALDRSVDPLLNTPPFRQTGIVKIGTLSEVDGYLYLQQKYTGLAPDIERALIRMKREGRIEKLGEQARQNWTFQPR